MVKINKMLRDFVGYFTEAFARVFGPSTDEYPEVGLQPFDGEPRAKTSDEI